MMVSSYVKLLYCINKLIHCLLTYKLLLSDVQGMPHEGPSLIVSKWPQSELPKDVKAVQQFDGLQSLVWATVCTIYNVNTLHILVCIIFVVCRNHT